MNDTVTEVFRRRIDLPTAWTSQGIGGKAGLVFPLSAAHLDAFDDLLAATRHLAPQAVTRAAFEHPLITPLLAELDHLIKEGRGTVVITGLTPARYSEEDFERIYWGCGTHWGEAAIQSKRGDRLGRVQAESDAPPDRGYLSDRELSFHADSYELVGLMAVRAAASGGLTRIVSAHALHNVILETRPHLLAPLYRGYRLHLPDYDGAAEPLTRFRVPVFSNVDGVVSINYSRIQMVRAAQYLNMTLPDDLVEALDYVDALCQRSDLHAEFMLEPGEMLVCSNWTVLHSRTRFVDGPRPRLLLRLWLSVPDGRRVIRALIEKGAAYDRRYRQVAAQVMAPS